MSENKIAPSEITPEHLYRTRRQFMRGAAVAGLGAGLAGWATPAAAALQLGDIQKSSYRADDEVTDMDKATSYNNFYEFGTDKSDPKANSNDFVTDPWTIEVGGEVGKPGKISLEDLVKPHKLEERIYRLRCVEAWSMVIPWVGIGLGDVLKKFEPKSSAKYVAFETVYRPAQMLGQRRSGLIDWPYLEGLRLDEAMHPLSLLAVGMYGKVLPNQNGAPIRLVVPWKYGFKSIKSIVKITLTRKQPPTTWQQMAPQEYGFYANVNPEVDHPRWSQKTERRIGDFFRRPTMKFNGYADEVAHLYQGMDLNTHY